MLERGGLFLAHGPPSFFGALAWTCVAQSLPSAAQAIYTCRTFRKDSQRMKAVSRLRASLLLLTLIPSRRCAVCDRTDRGGSRRHSPASGGPGEDPARLRFLSGTVSHNAGPQLGRCPLCGWILHLRDAGRQFRLLDRHPGEVPGVLHHRGADHHRRTCFGSRSLRNRNHQERQRGAIRGARYWSTRSLHHRCNQRRQVSPANSAAGN